MNVILIPWKYDKNKDYSIYYGEECIISINYGLMSPWRNEYIHVYGILSYISNLDQNLDDGESVSVTLNYEPPYYSIYSKLITTIQINYTTKTIINLNKLKDFIILKLNNDIFEEIKMFLLPDLIYI